MKSYKTFIIEFEEKEIIYFCKEENNLTNVISIERYGKNDFSYYSISLIGSMDNKTIHEKIYILKEFINEGCSCRGTIEEIIEDLNECYKVDASILYDMVKGQKFI